MERPEELRVEVDGKVNNACDKSAINLQFAPRKER